MIDVIDFSPKHHILIRHKDGTLTPMDEPYYEPREIVPDVWQIMSSGDYHYLVVGEDEGISIDTGYGAGNLREYLEQLCGKPVRKAVNTHHHFDHSANNTYFDEVYMGAEAVDLAAIPYPSFEGIDFPRDYRSIVVGDGDVIPLKGHSLQVFRIGDHTADGIAILDPESRLMFTGDELMPGGKRISGSVEKFVNDMAKLMEHRSEFDRICGGPEILDAETVDIFYEAGLKILAGEETSGDEVHRRMIKPGHHFGDPEGVLIYDCQHPHPEDVHKEPRLGSENMGHLSWRGCNFLFDRDRIRG